MFFIELLFWYIDFLQLSVFYLSIGPRSNPGQIWVFLWYLPCGMVQLQTVEPFLHVLKIFVWDDKGTIWCYTWCRVEDKTGMLSLIQTGTQWFGLASYQLSHWEVSWLLTRCGHCNVVELLVIVIATMSVVGIMIFLHTTSPIIKSESQYKLICFILNLWNITYSNNVIL